MQSFLEGKQCCPSICQHKLQAQHSAERGPIDETKLDRPPSSRGFIASGEHADSNRIPILLDRFELPRFRAHEAVRRRARIPGLVSKPREADWHASANSAAMLPMRLG